jgi:thermitase
MCSTRRYAGFLLPVLVLVALTGAMGSAADASTRTQSSVGLLVKFEPSASVRARAAALAAAGAREVGLIRDLDVHVVAVPNGRADAALNALSRGDSIEYVERDQAAQAMDVTPNDYWWPNEWAQTDVGAPRAWSLTTGSSSTVVAVLDTGVDPTQPDLAGSFVPGWNTLSNSSDSSDTSGHGTNVAGVALARSNNATGIASYCWSCSLMPVKVLDTGAGTDSTVANGITWATDHGARIISMSLGFTASSTTLQNAVAYAHNHNVVLIAAAGNYGTNSPVYPAAYPQVLGVAGTDSTDHLYSWSSYGSWAKLAAPGCDFATGLNSWYGTFCGTSAAAPALAGIAGLAASCAPSATNTQIEQALEASAVAIGSAVQYGRVDAYKTLTALGCGASAATPTATPPASTTLPTISGTAQASQTLTGAPGSWTGTAPITYTYQWNRCSTTCSAISDATSNGYTVASADVGATLTLTVTASNTAGTSSATSAATATVAAATTAASASATTATALSGSLNKAQASRSFSVSAGGGTATATLNFTKAASLTLTVARSDGSVIATTSGASALPLLVSLAAGSYTYTVSGTGTASFTLSLVYPTP